MLMSYVFWLKCFFGKIFGKRLFCCVYLLIVSVKIAAVSKTLEFSALSNFFAGGHPGESCRLYPGCGKVV